MAEYKVRGVQRINGLPDTVTVVAASTDQAWRKGEEEHGLEVEHVKPVIHYGVAPAIVSLAIFLLWSSVVITALATVVLVIALAMSNNERAMLMGIPATLAGGVTSAAVPVALMAIIRLMQERSRD